MDTDQQMRGVLLELMMLMHGSTTSWNPTTSGTRDRDPRPSGDNNPIAEQYAVAYDKATNELAKQRVLHDAKEDLERWRGHGVERHAGESRQEEEARMLREGEGWAVEDVARRWGCTKRRVRRICAEHEVGIDYRDVICAVGAVSRASLAQSMCDAGSTQDAIGEALGIHRSNVSRLLKTARRQAA